MNPTPGPAEHTNQSAKRPAILERKILSPGRYLPEYKDGSKLVFHFKTEYKHGDTTVEVDNSRNLSKPMELILGKQFKLEIWEQLLKSMCVKEISQFHINREYVKNYPYISKIYRDFAGHPKKGKTVTGSCCGIVSKFGLGYQDLDVLMYDPKDLIFTFDLMEVFAPDQFTKEHWLMNDDDIKQKISECKDKGNKAYAGANHKEAEEWYLKGISYIEQILVKKVPKTDEFRELQSMQAPFWLNLAQVKLKQNDNYAAINYCDKVLQVQPDNTKAYYRRAVAHGQVWDQSKAEQDFAKVIQLDESLSDLVNKEREVMRKRCQQGDRLQKQQYRQKMFESGSASK